MKQSRLTKRKLAKVKPVGKPKRKPLLLFVVLIFLSFFVLLGVIGYFLLPRSWNGKSKTSIVTQQSSGETDVVILDPQTSSITNLEIPGNTQVEASYQLGFWKLGSLTKLGEDKGIGGVFLKNSIIKSFNFPIDSWEGTNLLDLTSGNILRMLRGIFTSGSTNLSFLDKIRIGFFSMTVGNLGRNILKLEDSSYLVRSQLPDGILGWKIENGVPSNIKAYFVDSNTNASSMNVLINDASGGESLMVAKTLQVMGANIASIQPMALSKFDCKVTGFKVKVVDEIARIFSCGVNYSKPIDNFDIQIDLGSYFTSRF